MQVYLTAVFLSVSMMAHVNSCWGQSTNPVKTTNTQSLKTYTFNHSCEGNFNFNVAINCDGEGGFVALHNNIHRSSSSRGATNKAPARTQKGRVDTGRHETTPESPGMEVYDTSFNFSSKFDPVNFLTWIKNIYPSLNDDCAKYLTFKAGEEIFLHDSSYVLYKYQGKKSTPEQEKQKESSNATKPGKVYIVSSVPKIIDPVYSVSKQIKGISKNPRYEGANKG